MPWMLDLLILSYSPLNNREKSLRKINQARGRQRRAKSHGWSPHPLETTASPIREVPLTQSLRCLQAHVATAIAAHCHHKITWGLGHKKTKTANKQTLENFPHFLWALGILFPTLWTRDREILLELSQHPVSTSVFGLTWVLPRGTSPPIQWYFKLCLLLQSAC